MESSEVLRVGAEGCFLASGQLHSVGVLEKEACKWDVGRIFFAVSASSFAVRP